MSLLEMASGLAKRHLSNERVEALRGFYLQTRGRVAPVLRLVHGTFGVDDLRQHLEQRVGRGFEVLMVHSSVNGMRPMFTGSPLELVRMLIAYCGTDRTLAMPAFYFGEGDLGAYATFQRNPRFDLQRTPSQMGLATELFRRMPGVLQSRHPVYRIAAMGPLAETLTRGHEHASSPAGRGSPFEAMAACDTCIIGIGKPIQVLTQAHHTEEIMGDEFPMPSHAGAPLPMTLVERGREMPFELKGRSVDGRFNIWKLRQIMSSESLREWRFHHVPMFATRARDVTDQLVSAARRGVTLYDPV
jgi:aminoglycoside 3-N-acetyltransferase